MWTDRPTECSEKTLAEVAPKLMWVSVRVPHQRKDPVQTRSLPVSAGHQEQIKHIEENHA